MSPEPASTLTAPSSNPELRQDALRAEGSLVRPAEDPAVAAAIATLVASGRYQIVHRFRPGPRRYHQCAAPGKRAVFVDIETTGLDTHTDRIIQLALLPFTYTADGDVLETEECWVQLEDPGIDVPETISELTGLNREMLRGHRIATEAVDAIVENAQLVIAHNASFDRPMLERRFPVFRTKAWGCSQRDVGWKDNGYTSTRLEWLAYAHAGIFYEAHRADADCYVAVHLLATHLHGGGTALGALLTAARRPTALISAVDAPFDARSTLKARGYAWYRGSATRPKSWRREVTAGRALPELDWLRRNVYRGGSMKRVRCDPIDAYSRYSDRSDLV